VACGPHQAPQRQGLGAQRREDNVIVHLFSAVRKTAQAPPVTGDTRSGHVFRASAVGLYCETHSSGTSSMAVSRSLGALVLLVGLGSAPFDPAPAQRDNGAASPDSTGVAGQLVDRHTHEPIRAGQVLVLGTPGTATTDSSGRFALSALTPGMYALEIHAVGYTPVTWLATIEARHLLRHDFELDPLPVALPEVLVKGTTRLPDRRVADFERRLHSGPRALATQHRIEHAKIGRASCRERV